ncbi:recombinase family protein [Sphingomonas sp. MMS24-J45]|uniref:recombinase family protein n=1 Tax=Sphingomonas sp. MMS24-J45 TaxID=3238806 RepID=UPI00384A5671
MVIAAVAEFQRDLLIERTQAGLKRAVDQGARSAGVSASGQTTIGGHSGTR